MDKYRSILITFIAGICAIVSIHLAVQGFVEYKEVASGGITATGSATKDFVSDLIVWRGSFSAYGETTQSAYKTLKDDADIIKKYLLNNDIPDSEFIFSSVRINPQYRYEYNENGSIVAQYPNGFTLTQELTVQSNNVDKVETVSRDITELIDSGIDFISESPEYYYTKLDELKLEMIEAATQNAKNRIDLIAENSNSKTGKLLNASLGVFQITAQNSSSEEYSSSGVFNTWSKNKTASITVKLYYAID